MSPILRTLTALGTAAVLAACGSQTTSPQDEAAAPSAGEAATGSPAEGDDGGGSGAEATVADFTFSPGTIEVTTGTTVTWTNEDTFAHTVTSGMPNQPDETFDEALGEPNAHAAAGTTASVTFDEPGTYAYFCDLHPSMVGEVVVTAP